MAYIYKITNKVNDKIQIGKTERSVEERFQEHCREYKKERYEKRPLYNAMNKYGIENFFVETIEETDIPDEREVYWIEYQGSFKYGYNATIGGDGKKYLDYDLIYKVYLEVKSVKNTSILCKCDEDSVVKILEQYGINKETRIKNKNNNISTPIAKIDKNTNEILEIYSSITEAIKNNNLPNGSRRHLYEVNKGLRKSAYGFKWKYLN